jgi:YD repeat-containing protein
MSGLSNDHPRVTTFTYGGRGRCLAIAGARGRETRYDYDDVEGTVRETDPDGNTCRWVWTGEVTESIAPLSCIQLYSYRRGEGPSINSATETTETG